MANMSFLLATHFLLIFISITHAIYNGNCTSNADCSSSIAMRCENHRCICNTPWFSPCNSSTCVAEKHISYVGDVCRTDENCLDNARCNTTTNQCQCEDGFTDINSLCYKSLNSTCQHADECWSRECRQGLCQCPVGYKVQEDGNRCKLVLAKLYANWTLADENKDFCHDELSCVDQTAICRNDSIHADKFCQCPPTHTADYEKQTCEWKTYNGLSPSSRPLPETICGKCSVPNAICAHVGEQDTCWCKAGFVKENDQTCKKQQKKYIFPSRSNINSFQYDFNCLSNKSSGLCVCQPGYEFSIATSTCQPITPQWIDNQLEYGVCTQINSHGKPIRVEGLCPAPLQCEARKDKYVCSCGHDKYLDIGNKTCYSYLNRNVTDAKCPPNSHLVNSQCQCNLPDIYQSIEDKKCELKLTHENLTNCNLSVNDHGECTKRFGEYARFCKQGECRCLLSNSSYQGDKCVTLIGISATNGSCPTDAEIVDGKCQCKAGFRATQDNKACYRLIIPLSNSTNVQSGNVTIKITDADCQALYPGQDVEHINHSCICKEGSFAWNNKCISQLNYTFTSNLTVNHTCPDFASIDSDTCQCNPDYKQSDENTCQPLVERLYEHNQGNENITDFKDGICERLFGNAAEKHPEHDYCQCRNASWAFFQDNRCYFFIDVRQTLTVNQTNCPVGSIAHGQMCICPKYYSATEDKKGCRTETAPSLSFARKTFDPTEATCSSPYTNTDCENLYGSGTICHDKECYCDRSKAYVHNNECKLYSDNLFPGKHEWHLYTCESDTDCGTNGVECDFLDNDYKVCKCQENYYYNPIEKKCVEGLCGKCPNKERCQGYECVCEKGYYRDSSEQCVEIDKRFNLHDRCNQSYFNQFQSKNEEYECSIDCEHIRCRKGYQIDGTQCAKHQFDDRCAHDIEICERFPGAECDINENKCICQTGYYQADDEGMCVKSIGSSCEHDSECDKAGSCLNGRCQCKSETDTVDDEDSSGRHIKRCAKQSSVDQLKSYPIVILILMLSTHLFSA